jgi:hypothetical protein
MATLAEFPDRTLLGEDVIWSGSPEEGMLSSHRLHSTATHMHDGMYGAATGKKLSYRIMADCHAINNQITSGSSATKAPLSGKWVGTRKTLPPI